MMTTQTTIETRVSPRHALQYRQYVRQQCRARMSSPIVIVDGDAAPKVRGQSYYWETPSGQPVRYPSAYRRAFGRPVYFASTIRVEVGREWLAARCIPEQALAVA